MDYGFLIPSQYKLYVHSMGIRERELLFDATAMTVSFGWDDAASKQANGDVVC